MLNAVFLMNSVGDILVQKPLTITNHSWSPEIFFSQALRLVGKQVLPPCVKIDKAYYIHARKNDVYLVAVTTSQSSASTFLLLESLNNFIKECCDLIGDMTSQNVLDHIAVVYELVIMTFGLSHPDCITAQAISESKQMVMSNSNEDKLFPYVPSNLFGVVPSKEEKYTKEGSASKAPLSTKQQEKSNEIFVDLMEYFVALIDCQGQVFHTDLKGQLSTKSYLSGPVELQIALSDKIVEGKVDTKKQAENVVVSEKRFHHLVTADEEHQREKDFPMVKHLSNPGFSAVMDYHISSDSLPLPFTLYHNFMKTKKGSLMELTLTCKLFCALPSGVSPINWSATFPLPSKLQSVSGFSTLKSVQFHEDKEKRSLVLKSPSFPSQSHHSITISMILSELPPFIVYEMPHFNLEFEIPDLCISNMKIQGLKVQSITSNSAPNIAKWVRCSTHVKDYQFELKSDFVL